MSIYFVRHGETDFNIQQMMQGQIDIELNANGKKQAQWVRKDLATITFDKIYVSPLKRARETANIINARQRAQIVIEERIMERCFGVKEGENFKNINFQTIWTPSDIPPFPQAESSNHFYQRVNAFLEQIQEEAIHKQILLVAHGGVSIPFQCYFESYEQRDLNAMIIKNCEVIKKESKRKENTKG